MRFSLSTLFLSLSIPPFLPPSLPLSLFLPPFQIDHLFSGASRVKYQTKTLPVVPVHVSATPCLISSVWNILSVKHLESIAWISWVNQVWKCKRNTDSSCKLWSCQHRDNNRSHQSRWSHPVWAEGCGTSRGCTFLWPSDSRANEDSHRKSRSGF